MSSADPPADLLVKLVLNLVAVALSLAFGLAGYLSSATTGEAHHHPLLVGVVCFAVPCFAIRSCGDVLGHAVDALFLCWALDVDGAVDHCTKAAEAFGEAAAVPGRARTVDV